MKRSASPDTDDAARRRVGGHSPSHANEDATAFDQLPDKSQFKVACVILPGTENPKTLLDGGRIDVKWQSEGATMNIKKFKEKPLNRVEDSGVVLPTLYLHFLDDMFFPADKNAFDVRLRGGGDNTELLLVLPEEFVAADTFNLSKELGAALIVAIGLVRMHGEPETSAVQTKLGGFSPELNYKGRTSMDRMYISLQTARPKSPISFEKGKGEGKYGVPENADYYLFAQNHRSVDFMTDSQRDSFILCIEELSQATDERLLKLATFFKVFFEGGFVYNEKEPLDAHAFLPKTVGVAALGVAPQYEGQRGIWTGHPYLVEPSFLRFIDTVPVTIPGISAMSNRHARYGLCFTRCCLIWQDELYADGVLRYTCPAPDGGFFYVPSTVADFNKLGGLIYAFRSAEKERMEAVEYIEGNAS